MNKTDTKRTAAIPALLHWMTWVALLAPNAAFAAKPPALQALYVENGRIVDASGRETTLRGLNHIGLRGDRNRPANWDAARVDEFFDLQDVEDEDFELIASFGFNVLRLVVTWEFAQPMAPTSPDDSNYNETYFGLIDSFIDKAADHGIYVIFDFGQFGWGRSAGGNAGAPAWTESETCKSLPGPSGSAPPHASGRVGCNFYNFWTDGTVVAGRSTRDWYFQLWRYVAARYQNNPAVPIFDLFNEPFGGPIPPGVFELEYLYPFYRELSAAIREIDADRIIGFQPELYHSIGIPMPVPALEPIGEDNTLYLPHDYTLAYWTQRFDPRYPPGQDVANRAYFELARHEAEDFGTGLLVGETGWTRTTAADGVEGPRSASDPEAPPKFAHSLTAIANEMRFGWTWFAYSTIDAAYGIRYQGETDQALMAVLAQPFVRHAGGPVASESFDLDQRHYMLEFQEVAQQPSLLSVPTDWQYVDGACVLLDDIPSASIRNGKLLNLIPQQKLAFYSEQTLLEVPENVTSISLRPLDQATCQR